MFLPFLPLILASAGLTLFSGELERTEPWLNLPLAVNLSLIILLSFLLAQMPQWLWQFSKLKRFPEVRKGSYSSTNFSRPRTLILIGWLALVYGEHLDLRIGHLFNNITDAESVSFGVLLLFYWLADAVAAIPVYQWNAHGLEEKIKKSVLHLRLQLPVLALIIIQTVWFWITSKFLLSFTSNWSLIFELLCSLILMVLVAPVVFVKSWGAKAIENGNDFEEIRKELENSRTPVTAILSWPDSIMPYSTAGVIGFVRGFRYLLISPQLLKSLSATELRAVTAHEAGHLRKQHLLFYLLAFICLLELFAFAGSANLLLTWTGVLEVSGMLMGVASILSIILFIRFGIGFLSQNFERQADCHAFERHGISPISTALMKVSLLNGINPEQDNWHHYGIQQRIDFLSICLKKPEMLQKHHRRVFRIKLVCAVLLVGLLGANYMLSSDTLKIKVLAWKLEQSADIWQLKDAPMLTKMGDLLYFQDQKTEAELWYRRALEMNPEESHTLNNLAWLLTEKHNNDKKRLRESIELAQKASTLKQAAFIWDTLAEAYLINGKYEAATDAARQALKLAKAKVGLTRDTNLDYYREKLERITGQ
ncbi:MAG: M48 family metalloprotease [SAR324 cluster bacterium]|nr:M48 family metalloprotease [SAR324 cluster bacterium]